MVTPPQSALEHPLLDVLPAAGPLPALAEPLMLFGQFVGSWEVAGRFFEPDGSSESHTAEWHFGWVLGGRAIQDVLIRPARARLSAGEPLDEWGSTIRLYDPAIDAWRVTWIAAASGRVVNLLARPRGDDIWIEGRAPGGELYRWTFTEITDRSFRWDGFQSQDEGASWFRGQEMLARRRG